MVTNTRKLIETTLADIHEKNKDINAFIMIYDDIKRKQKRRLRDFVGR
jgi:hypothetical protein